MHTPRFFLQAVLCSALLLPSLAAAKATPIITSSFAFEGFSFAYPETWKPASLENEIAALRNWDGPSGAKLEIMAYIAKRPTTLRKYLVEHDTNTFKSCDGKPAATVKQRLAIGVNGFNGTMRLEDSCVVDREFLVTYIALGKNIVEFTTWNDKRDTITEKDIALHKELIRGLRLLKTK